MNENLDVILNYKENGADITATYRVSEETLRLARSWQAQTPNPTAKDLSDWLENNGGRLHSTDGPAVIEREADGSTCESYYTDGKRHRADGPAVVMRYADSSTREQYYTDGKRHRADGPAVIERDADGSTCEAYFVDDKLHRADGPAIVMRQADGSAREEYYNYGNFVKEERLSSLSTISGVTIRPNLTTPAP